MMRLSSPKRCHRILSVSKKDFLVKYRVVPYAVAMAYYMYPAKVSDFADYLANFKFLMEHATVIDCRALMVSGYAALPPLVYSRAQ